ncbi:MAG: phosphatidylglycerophosphatase A [Mameliella sp.]|nr:phosphatidylglycerophosphatase A [Mameliella sp.]|tara:strand:- start:1286 stop:1771 length:486 start_codon:yes stop_codon:yes gene_type:complete
MRWLASVGGVGYLRPAPGTWGSLAALPLAYGVHMIGGFWLLLVLTIAAFGLGWLAVIKLTADGHGEDPSWVVVDELVGQWIALFPISYGAMLMSVDLWRLWPGWIAGFVLFRLFDIWKPWIIGAVDRMGTPLGVMLDDVLAGILAAMITVVLAGISHGMLM